MVKTEGVYTARRSISCFICNKEISPGEKYTYRQIRPKGGWVSCHLRCVEVDKKGL